MTVRKAKIYPYDRIGPGSYRCNICGKLYTYAIRGHRRYCENRPRLGIRECGGLLVKVEYSKLINEVRK